jgi:hypothetical protein
VGGILSAGDTAATTKHVVNLSSVFFFVCLSPFFFITHSLAIKHLIVLKMDALQRQQECVLHGFKV